MLPLSSRSVAPHNIIPSGMGVVPGPSVTLFMEPGTKLEINMDNARSPMHRDW